MVLGFRGRDEMESESKRTVCCVIVFKLIFEIF